VRVRHVERTRIPMFSEPVPNLEQKCCQAKTSCIAPNGRTCGIQKHLFRFQNKNMSYPYSEMKRDVLWVKPTADLDQKRFDRRSGFRVRSARLQNLLKRLGAFSLVLPHLLRSLEVCLASSTGPGRPPRGPMVRVIALALLSFPHSVRSGQAPGRSSGRGI
jgi:hypothetical protein